MERQNSLQEENNKKLCCSGLVERSAYQYVCSLSLFSDISFVKRAPKVEQKQAFFLSEYMNLLPGGLASSSGRQQDFSNSDTTLLLNSFHCLVALSKKSYYTCVLTSSFSL
jgi:hypothetical protein